MPEIAAPAIMAPLLAFSRGIWGATLKAIRFHEVGGPEVLKLEEVEDPKPGTGQALVRVWAAGVNPTDITSRRGGGAGQVKLPGTLGRDGTVG